MKREPLRTETRVKRHGNGCIFTQHIAEINPSALPETPQGMVGEQRMLELAPGQLKAGVDGRRALRWRQNSGQLTLKLDAMGKRSTRSNATEVVVSIQWPWRMG